MDQTHTDGSGSPKGYTSLLGPVYTFDEYRCKYLGPLKPLVHLNLGYTLLHRSLYYAVSGFDPAFGADIAVGVQRNNINLRLGYRNGSGKQDCRPLGSRVAPSVVNTSVPLTNCLSNDILSASLGPTR